MKNLNFVRSLMTALTVPLLAPLLVVGCAPKERPAAPATVQPKSKPDLGYEAPTPEAAFSILPPEQQLAFSAWKLGLVKNCSVPDAFLLDDGQKPYGPQNVGLDAKIFMAKTQNSLILQKRNPDLKDEAPGENLPFGRSRGEFAILGAPVPLQGNQVNRFVFPLNHQGAPVFINIEAEVQKEKCTIRVAGQKLFETSLIAQVPVEAYYSEGKALSVPPVNSENTKSQTVGDRMGFDGKALAEPFRAVLDPASPQGSYLAMDFLGRYFQMSDQNNFTSRFFFLQPLTAGAELTKRMGIRMVSETGENPFFGVSGWIYGSTKDLGVFTKPGTIDEGDKKNFSRTRYQISVRPAKMDIAGIRNTADENNFRVDYLVDYQGSLKTPSRSSLRALKVMGSEPADANQAKICLVSRLQGAETFQAKQEKPLGFGVEASEVISPCSANSTELAQLVASSPEARTSLARFSTKSSDEKDFLFRGWDEFTGQVAKALMISVAPEKAAETLKQSLDPADQLPAVTQAAQNLQSLVAGFESSSEVSSVLGGLAEMSLRSSIRGVKLEANLLGLVSSAGARSLPVFRPAFEATLAQLSAPIDVLALEEVTQLLTWASQVTTPVLAAYSRIQIEAVALGIPQFQKDLVSRFAVLKNAESNASQYLASLELARKLLDEDLSRFSDGMTVETARYREEFANMVVTEKWTSLQIEGLRTFLTLKDFLKTARSECRKPKDLASQVICIRDRVNTQAFSSTTGLFIADRLAANVKFAQDLSNLLSKFPSDHVMTDRVANRFFAGGWTLCSSDEIQARNYLVRAYLAAILQDPKKSNPNLENGVEQNFRACAAK